MSTKTPFMCHNSEPIRALDCSLSFNEANFCSVNYQDIKGETRPEILMTRDVARVFGKEHSKVLRDIRALECSPAFCEANFGFANYQDGQGKARPEILMTRDVARVFGKEHKNVLQAINALDCSQSFNELNFQPSEARSTRGGS